MPRCLHDYAGCDAPTETVTSVTADSATARAVTMSQAAEVLDLQVPAAAASVPAAVMAATPTATSETALTTTTDTAETATKAAATAATATHQQVRLRCVYTCKYSSVQHIKVILVNKLGRAIANC
jgi:hypothetical protein